MTALEEIHRQNLAGDTTVVQLVPAYISELYGSGTTEGIIASHQDSLDGKNGAGAQNMALGGETVHEMLTKPGKSIKGAVRFWGDFF